MRKAAKPLEMTEQVVPIAVSAALAETANQIAKKQGWPLPKALSYLAERGASAQKHADSRIAAAYAQLQNTSAGTPEYKRASDALYDAIFG